MKLTETSPYSHLYSHSAPISIGRWQRLSAWRKAIAIGGFALGTFGLGFTLGGLVFGRWRKA